MRELVDRVDRALRRFKEAQRLFLATSAILGDEEQRIRQPIPELKQAFKDMETRFEEYQAEKRRLQIAHRALEKGTRRH